MWNLDDPARAPDRRWLDKPGGFLWWYVDALDAEGTGLVCIWSWGLPFLPGDRSARLRGEGPAPLDRPSFNLVLYRNHQPISYTLYRPHHATWSDDAWTFDDTHITRTRVGGNTTLHARIDLPISGSDLRIHGTFTLTGPTAWLDEPPAAVHDHAWAPLTGPSRLDVSVHAGHTSLCLARGLPAYHDRNASPIPLDGMGMRRWTWGRHLLGDRTWIHYLSWPDSPDGQPELVAIDVASDGRVRSHRASSVQRSGHRRGRVGMTWWRHLVVPTPEGPLTILHGPPVDDGPFYLRMPTRATLGQHSSPGWAEWCEPDRVDRVLHRWPVSMCVQHADPSRESAWAPLFVGPAADRLPRLLSRWLGRTP